MIHQYDLSEKDHLEITSACKTLGISKLLRDANIRKTEGFSAMSIFMQLILLVFEGKNLFRLMESRVAVDRPKKDTYYRFLKRPSFAWRRFLYTLSSKVIQAFTDLTAHDRVKVLIIDDSLFSRSRSKKVELLRVYTITFPGRWSKALAC